MKRLILILAALVALAPGFAEETPAAADGSARGPRIRVEPAGFDFGRALPQKTLQKEFRIRNFGDQDLVIENISTTCGCTAALMESKVVKPGESSQLRVSLQTRDYRGRVVRSVLVRTNDPEAPITDIKLEANVVAR